ncbi:hypothetical protein TRSC58_00618 [Trypanosoma rangeli SC58]|uniref:ribonuclease P n=1 Tax=Trypanosoma rangeli SC58 TaxID=429131 RepID=A0A061JDZ5_TRYRA|nr:hypothetical protein TRSC58_00618 [Trypanosoma rangeli SC58]
MRRDLTRIALISFTANCPIFSQLVRWKSSSPAGELQRRIGQLVSRGQVEEVAQEICAGLEQSVFSMKAFASALFLCEQTHKENVGMELVRRVQASQLVEAWTDESVLAVILRLQCSVGDVSAATQMFSYMAYKKLLRLRSASVFLNFWCERGDRRMTFAVYEEVLRQGIELRAADYVALGRLCVAVGEPVSTLHFMLREMQEHVLNVPEAMVTDVLKPWAQTAGIHCAEVQFPHKDATREPGTCSCCGDVLRGHRFTAAQKTGLLNDVMKVVTMTPRGNLTRVRVAFEAWRRFILTHGQRIDVLIDGANLGYYGLSSWYEEAKRALLLKHGVKADKIMPKDVMWTKHRAVDVTVNFQLIDLAVQEARHRGMQPLILLHERHCESKNLTAESEVIVANWRCVGILYCTPSGLNDDLCWLYAALELTTPTDTAAAGSPEKTVWVLTNDLMRDHHFKLLSPRFFARWRDRHRIAFKCSREDGRTLLHWEMPEPYARCIQELKPLAWHIPISHAEDTTFCAAKKQWVGEEGRNKTSDQSEEEEEEHHKKDTEDNVMRLPLLSHRWVCVG